VVSIRFSDREMARLDAGCGGPGNRGTYLREMFLAPVPGAAGAVTPEAPAAASAAMPDLSAVTRFEVIDHARIGSGGKVTYSPEYPRSVVALGVSVELSVQDDGRTLKVFLR
jgi:hypothetical protein